MKSLFALSSLLLTLGSMAHAETACNVYLGDQHAELKKESSGFLTATIGDTHFSVTQQESPKQLWLVISDRAKWILVNTSLAVPEAGGGSVYFQSPYLKIDLQCSNK